MNAMKNYHKEKKTLQSSTRREEEWDSSKKNKEKRNHKAAKSSQQTNKHKERPWWRGVEKLYLKLWNSCPLPVVNLELSGFVLGLLPLHPKKPTTKPTSLVFARVCATLVFFCTLVVSLLGCLQRFCGYGARRARESVSRGAIWRRIPTQTATTSFRSRGFLLCRRRRRRMATRLSTCSSKPSYCGGCYSLWRRLWHFSRR